jgi:hypothetical protein
MKRRSGQWKRFKRRPPFKARFAPKIKAGIKPRLVCACGLL